MLPDDDAFMRAAGRLKDRQVFTLSPDEWGRLGQQLHRPVCDKPRIAALLAERSVLER